MDIRSMADTCGTLAKAAQVLMEHKAKEVVAIVTRTFNATGNQPRLQISQKPRANLQY
jgi:phosphoribosylpyrophosphate synthetase